MRSGELAGWSGGLPVPDNIAIPTVTHGESRGTVYTSASEALKP